MIDYKHHINNQSKKETAHMENVAQKNEKSIPGAIKIDEKEVFDHLDTLVHPYIFLDGVYLKRSWGGEVHESSVLVAIGVNSEGYRKILGVAEGSREDKESWSNFLRYLKERGLKGVKLVISDKAAGLVDVLGDFFPKAQWQRCVVHWYRNAFEITSVTKAPHRTLMYDQGVIQY